MSKERLGALLSISALGFVCYFNSLSVPFIWDDTALITNNFLIKDFRYIGRIFSTDLFNLLGQESSFYRPLQALSYMLDYHIWGLNPLGFHLTNILLHIANACLVYVLAGLFIRRSEVRGRRSEARYLLSFVPLVTAFLFVVHPIHTEAVTYISGRADLLAALFMLLGFIAYIRGQRTDGGGRRPPLSSLLCFTLALLCKEMSLIFPLALLIYELILERGTKGKWNRLWPFCGAGGVYAALRLGFFPVTLFPALSALWGNLPFFLKSIFLYIGMLLLPLDLHMSRTVTLPRSLLEPGVLLSLFGLIIIGALIVRLRAKYRLSCLAIAWFLVFLLPYMGIFRINAYFAEHFCYLASVGIFLLAGIALGRGRWRMDKIIVFGPALFYGLLTVGYNFAWHNEEAFYRRIIRLSSGSFAAYNNLAAIEERRGDYARAEAHYLKALNIKPEFDQALLNLLRVIYLSGRRQQAISQLKDFISAHPGSCWAWANLGSMYAQSRRLTPAIEAYRRSLALNPSVPNHHYFLGMIFSQAGDLDAAARELSLALGLDNKSPAYHNDLGVIYKNMGLLSQAAKEYLSALELAPDNPYILNNLAVAYSLMGDNRRAEIYFSRAVKSGRGLSPARHNLEIMLQK